MFTTQPFEIGITPGKQYTVAVNAAWITIKEKRTGEVVFKREPGNTDWYDAKHLAIVNAIYELEKALTYTVLWS